MSDVFPLGYLINESLYSAKDPVVCDCGGEREFEPLAEPPVMEKVWHVCPCCGTRKLLPEDR